jgi:hypothetical protein
VFTFCNIFIWDPFQVEPEKSKKKNKRATDILEHVRHDHSRIMHVVKEFGAKVSTMYVIYHELDGPIHSPISTECIFESPRARACRERE